MTGKLRDGVMKRGSTWSYVIRVRDPETGVSKPKWVGGFRSEDAAKAARDEARVKARRGEFIDRSRITLGQYLDDWIEAHAVETKPKTISDYRYLVEHYIRPRLGAMRLQAVRPATLTKFYRELRESGREDGRPLSFNTVNHVHTVLRKALRDAVLVDELLPFNPAERAKRPRRDNTVKMHIWTPDELRCFLRLTEPHRLHALFRLAAYTGARRGELLFLRWHDVDLGEATVAIRGSANVIRGQRVEGTTKGGRERVVGIDAGTVDVLRRHRSWQEQERRLVGDGYLGRGYVFATGLGAPLYPDTPAQLMGKFIRQYNQPRDAATKPARQLPHARFHDLRHVHASMLLLAGVPVHVVAERLGHADPAITLRVYAHVIRQHTAGVADTFARHVGDDGPGDASATG